MDHDSIFVLDVSRLLSRRARGTPTGIDRVELNEAQRLLALDQDVRFVATRGQRTWFLARADVERLCAALEGRWAAGSPEGRRSAEALLAWLGAPASEPAALQEVIEVKIAGPRHPRSVLRTRAIEAELAAQGRPVTYRNVSHHHLDKAGFLGGIKARWKARIEVFWHDGIPLSFPEYARDGDAEKHRQRLVNMLQSADAITVNSRATADELARLAAAQGLPVPALDIDPLKPGLPPPSAKLDTARPYFVTLGTIEPRKNHRLLLEIWRAMAAELGERTPALVLVGRRGWMSSDTFALLDRCAGIAPHVFEAADLPDDVLATLLASSRALLMPSFAEGFGLPVAEAAALDVPVLASDLPVYAEFAAGGYEALSPLDGLGWMRRIKELAS